MFGTLRYNAGKNDSQYVEHPDSLTALWGKFATHLACDNCRAKKLKCDGNTNGCHRCTTSSTRCVYTRYSKKRDRHGKAGTGQAGGSASKAPAKERSAVRPSEKLISGGSVAAKTAQEVSIGDFDQPISLCDSRDSQSEHPLGLEGDDMFLDQVASEMGLEFTPYASETSLQGLDSWQRSDFTGDHNQMNFEPSSSSSSEELDDSHYIQTNLSPLPTPSSTTAYTGSSPQIRADDDKRCQRVSFAQSSVVGETWLPNLELDLFQTRAGGSKSTKSKINCDCSSGITTLLEESERRSRHVEIERLDGTLAFCKESLEECNNMLECSHCNSLSDHMMLLVVACQKLVCLMEDSLRQLARWKCDYGSHKIKHRASFNMETDDPQKKLPTLFFGDYTVDINAQAAAIARFLVMLQFKEMLRILGALKEIAVKIEQIIDTL